MPTDLGDVKAIGRLIYHRSLALRDTQQGMDPTELPRLLATAGMPGFNLGLLGPVPPRFHRALLGLPAGILLAAATLIGMPQLPAELLTQVAAAVPALYGAVVWKRIWPWRYVWRNYVTTKGGRWRSPLHRRHQDGSASELVVDHRGDGTLDILEPSFADRAHRRVVAQRGVGADEPGAGGVRTSGISQPLPLLPGKPQPFCFSGIGLRSVFLDPASRHGTVRVAGQSGHQGRAEFAG
ncbi:hypothetical protein [Arthrobacter sp. GCM10027362]|uniref:hypothetical protein n=1 Tax=Arthrobacter sp. GCM10027362 TaxID=3273379 RepID=UPI00367087F2